MLAIRMQRTGRSGHAQFRVVVQDSKFSPTRGRVVSYVGSYNPHTKTAKLDTEKVAKYLENGAQPSDSVARLLKKEGVKLPSWVKLSEPKKRDVRNPDKRRSTAPATAEPAATPEEPAAETTEPAQESAVEETVNEVPTEDHSADEPAADEAASQETPAEEPAPTEEAPAAEAAQSADEPASENS